MAVRWRSRQHLLELPGVIGQAVHPVWPGPSKCRRLRSILRLTWSPGNAGSVMRRRAGAGGGAAGVDDKARLRAIARSRARLDGIAKPMPLASSTSSARALESAARAGWPEVRRRQGERHGGAVPWLAGRGQLAAVRADQVGRDRQADAAAGGLGRLPAAPEPVEDDPAAGLGEFQRVGQQVRDHPITAACSGSRPQRPAHRRLTCRGQTTLASGNCTPALAVRNHPPPATSQDLAAASARTGTWRASRRRWLPASLDSCGPPGALAGHLAAR